MFIKKLFFTEYGKDGWGAKSHWDVDPKWENIAIAVRRLDRFRYPFIWMYLDREAVEDSLPNLDVIGGDGAWAMDGLRDGKQVRYINSVGGEEMVPVWTSDQGCEVQRKFVCYDMATALESARYLFDHGELDPRLNWVSM